MDDPQLTVTVSERVYQEARAFLAFLKKAAQKHSLAISLSSNPPTEFTCSFARKDGEKFDLFLQQLMFNQGLYYYLCNVRNRREIARAVVKPIFQELLDWRFKFINPALLGRHILKASPGWMAGDFADETAQEYETLFHQLKLKTISGFAFVRDVDDMLTEFML